MGAANWLAGGVNRAVSGVRSALPGTAQEDEQELARQPAPARVRELHPTSESPDRPAAGPAPDEPASGQAPDEPASGETPDEPAAGPVSGVPADTPADSDPDGPSESQAGWSEQELTEFRTALDADIVRLREELNMGRADLAEMLDHNDPAGDDQADAGAQTLEREQEMSVAANAQDLLEQSLHALQRLDAGTYGICESCGRAIPAARLRAFPRATLCIACKQREERG